MLILSTVLVVFVATFLAASIAVGVAWLFLQRRADQEANAAGADLSAASGDSPVLFKEDVLSTISVLARLLARFNFVHPMKTRIAEADLDWSVGRVTAMMLLSGALASAALLNLDWAPPVVAIGGGFLAGFLPYSYVLRRRAARLAAFEEQFPEALEFLARALRAGHPFAVGLEMVANESLPPMSVEMRKTFDERQLGLSWDQALANLVRRVPLVDVSFFTAAVQLQTRTGGKLNEVLAKLAETMRERVALKGEIRAISAHGRLTGIVLTALPIVVMAVMVVVSPAYIAILLGNPYGKYLIGAGVVCLTLAHFVIRRIVRIEV